MPPVKHYSSSEVNQYELSMRLLSLTENNTSYTLTQVNGQRIYRKAPHAWSGPEPSRNCEVFIGRIPHDCFEDTLVPLFRQAGELFEFRLMINFSGWNRGYAFAMYTTEAEAGNAIRLFNNYMIRPSWQLGVCPSINNCRIFISRIPASTASAEIVRLLYALTDEVQEVRIRRSAASCAAIVEYRSHRGAAMARKALVAAAAAAWGPGARPTVDWSLPQSPQLFKQYREIGRWSPERGVEMSRAEDSAPPAAPSYALEPWSQARRLRMIRHAQRSASTGWSSPPRVECASPALSSLQLGMCVGAGERAVWAPPQAPDALDLSGPLGLTCTFGLTGALGLISPTDFTGLPDLMGSLSLMGSLESNLPGSFGLTGSLELPQPRAEQQPTPREFNPWTARHPLQEFASYGKQ